MSEWDYPGAKWWKFDFHTHTPASDDFLQRCTAEKKDEVTPEYWLRKFMEQDIDCVAITDHNSGAWVDSLKEALVEIKKEEPKWYKPIYLFPGVEISAQGGVHILAIFGQEKTTSDIDSLLGAVDYKETRGKSDGVTKKSITEVIDIVAEHGGIPIPAHADREKGLFTVLRGKTLEQVMDNHHLNAVEVCDERYKKPDLYQERGLNWAEVRGSDTHNFRNSGFGIFTWVKMGEKPSIEGLKLALLDGATSINRNMKANPNIYADCIIESLEVNGAKYMGRPDSLMCRLSPFLNAIIGGRGSGKSTLLEFMRLALRRKDELSEEMANEKENYFSTDNDDGLLREESELSLVYRKGDTRYKLIWQAEPSDASIYARDKDDGEWQEQDGEISSLFPVRIYSQKQIYELASNPQGLLSIIDNAPEIGFERWQQVYRDHINQYKNVIYQYQQLQSKVSEESNLKGQKMDLTRQINQIEKSEHKRILTTYRMRSQQLREIESIEEDWQYLGKHICESLDVFEVPEIKEDLFVEHPEILSALKQQQEQWQGWLAKIKRNVDGMTASLAEWDTKKSKSDWMKSLKDDIQLYGNLEKELEEQGIDPKSYPTLLQQRTVIEKELNDISKHRMQITQLNEEKERLLAEIRRNRRELTQQRKKFLMKTLRDNKSISIEVLPFGEEWKSVEKRIRRILQTGDRFDKDFEEIKIVHQEKGYEGMKGYIWDIHAEKSEARDSRFRAHLKNLSPEVRANFKLWFPEDSLDITYKDGAHGKKLKSGSPGQKSAALLAFILSYGEEPLLLDQPEDDLDNDLISDLIVKNLKGSKQKRQIIVVTHNPNIVVNGDSELVHSLKIDKGQTVIESGSMQEVPIRKSICDIMEGGRRAFEQRYRRIHLEYPDA